MSFYRKTFDILLKKYKFLLFDSLGKQTKIKILAHSHCKDITA